MKILAAGGHFGCPKNTFGRISGHFRSIRNLFFYFFYKMAAGGHFGCPKITFGRISGHFRSIRNFFKYFFYKMAAVGHFGCPKFIWITFLAILDQYRYIVCSRVHTISILLVKYVYCICPCNIILHVHIIDPLAYCINNRIGNHIYSSNIVYELIKQSLHHSL